MPYPLGSFPSYGYQARNAAIRRQTAKRYLVSRHILSPNSGMNLRVKSFQIRANRHVRKSGGSYSPAFPLTNNGRIAMGRYVLQ